MPRHGAQPAISDVTKQINDATVGKSGADYIKAKHAAQSAIEKNCAANDTAGTRCDVITLYEGGRYALYRYKRFRDVRVSFAPDQDIAFFGGDPDNFNYPRYDVDVTFLRAYENGKPAHTAYFPFDPKGPKAGELVITSGNPGLTQRNETTAQVTALHDDELPLTFGYLEGLDGLLWEYSRGSAARQEDAAERVFGTQNVLKVYGGWFTALAKPALLARKDQEQADLLAWINADPQRKQAYGDPFATIKATVTSEESLFDRYAMLVGPRRPLAFDAPEFAYARTLVRAAAERQKPDGERLTAYRDANLPALEEGLLSAKPVHADLDETTLAFSLTKMRQVLGADDALVRLALGKSSPEDVARRLVTGTKLGDAKVRRALWARGQSVASSDDPMIRFALLVDPSSRAVEKQWENEVEAPQTKGAELIAKARFARDGTSIYPDATFTERLSFGTVEGWNEDGHPVAPFTTFAGLYDRATGTAPFMLSGDWLTAKGHIDLATPLDFVTTNDIIGGNSGSPIIDRDAHVVGLIFDGNIHSLAGNFFYDGSVNRAVSVDSAALLTTLRDVYDDKWLADELVAGDKQVTD